MNVIRNFRVHFEHILLTKARTDNMLATNVIQGDL